MPKFIIQKGSKDGVAAPGKPTYRLVLDKPPTRPPKAMNKDGTGQKFLANDVQQQIANLPNQGTAQVSSVAQVPPGGSAEPMLPQGVLAQPVHGNEVAQDGGNEVAQDGGNEVGQDDGNEIVQDDGYKSDASTVEVLRVDSRLYILYFITEKRKLSLGFHTAADLDDDVSFYLFIYLA